MKTFLKVPFAEKDCAKALGAKWDVKKKMWYVINKADLSDFEKWLIKTPTPQIDIKKIEITPLTEEETPWLSDKEIEEKLLSTKLYTYLKVN